MEIATRFLPHWLTILLRKIKYFGRERHCLLCGGNVRFFRSFGVVPRPNVYCPVCRSLDRHRLLWKFFQKHTNLLDQTFKSMLHVAPEPEIDRKLIKVPSIQYVTADLYKTDVMEKMDITDIHYADNSFDVICCCHVLEHVSDDRKAVNEFYRVLKPNGWAVLMVPIIRETTFEDPSVTDPLERRKVFRERIIEGHMARTSIISWRIRICCSGYFCFRNYRPEGIRTFRHKRGRRNILM